MGERLFGYATETYTAETLLLKPRITPDQIVAKLYAIEARKQDGGNAEFKELMWLSGLVGPFQKEKGAERLFNRLEATNLPFGIKRVLMQRYIEKNNRDQHKGDPTQLDLEQYYKKPEPRQVPKAA